HPAAVVVGPTQEGPHEEDDPGDLVPGSLAPGRSASGGCPRLGLLWHSGLRVLRRPAGGRGPGARRGRAAARGGGTLVWPGLLRRAVLGSPRQAPGVVQARLARRSGGRGRRLEDDSIGGGSG